MPAGTVLFMTRAWSAPSGSVATTASTRERSASPEYVGGVSTQQNRIRAARERLVDVGLEVQSLAVALDHLAQAGLVDRQRLARAQAGDLALVDVDARRRGGRARRSTAAVTRPTQPTPITPMAGFSDFSTGRGSYLDSYSRIEVAIESIWPSSSDCSSVLFTQYAAFGVFQPTSRRRSPS